MRELVCVVLVGAMAAGCGDNLGGATDAPPAPSDGRPDGPPAPDGRPDAIVPDATPSAARFVLSRARVPTDSTETQEFGQDLDSGEPGGDAAVDNQLGAVLAAVSAQGFDVQSGVDFSIDHGGSITLFDLLDDGTLNTYAGTDPVPPACNAPDDLVCRRHLDGAGSFDLVAAAPTGSMPSTVVADTTVGGPGTAVIDLLLLGNAAPLHLQLIGARFSADLTPTGFANGRLAGAVTTAQIDGEVIPAVGAAFRAQVLLDCAGTPPPGCGCDPGSQGENLIAIFDTPTHDCDITDVELLGNGVIDALFASDVTIGGVAGVSLGIAIDAVPATFRFTPP